MPMRAIVAILLIGVAAVAVFAWSRNMARSPAAPPEAAGDAAGTGNADTPAPGASDVMVESAGDPGITWTVPKRWGSESGSSMRLATYTIPAGDGSGEKGRCAVFYFGPGQGGGIEDNIARWIDEFENPGKPERSSRTSGGFEVARVRVRGTYVAHAGMSGGAPGSQKNFELLGAIVKGPNGSVFFKLTGPAKTVDAAFGEFDGMLASLRKP